MVPRESDRREGSPEGKAPGIPGENRRSGKCRDKRGLNQGDFEGPCLGG